MEPDRTQLVLTREWRLRNLPVFSVPQGGNMKAKTGIFLYELLWWYDTLTRPTGHNITDNFEGWAYRRGFHRQIVRLERMALIESRAAPQDQRVIRLTQSGRLLALGGRDPEECWNKPWDGTWRMVTFDIPLAMNNTRNKLRGALRKRGFGCLQQSIWITPHPMNVEKQVLAGEKVAVDSLILLEARPCAGETSQQIVLAAWDFEKINEAYATYQHVLRQLPRNDLPPETLASALLRWAEQERQAWLVAVSMDPLLPECLLPRGYEGRKAWKERGETQALARAHTGGLEGGLRATADI